MKNKYEIYLDKLDDMSLEEIEAVEKEIAVDYKVVLEYQKKHQSKSKGKATPTIAVFTGITSFRYGAMNLYVELGLDHNNTYSKQDLIKLLNENGYFEFTDKNCDFSQHDSDGTVVITIKGNSKGNIPLLPFSVIDFVSMYFQEEYHKNKSEARVLIYISDKSNKDSFQDFIIKIPKQVNTTHSTISDIELNFYQNGTLYNLTHDFHSHHVIGAYFSSQDDFAEQFKGVIYGVFSWAHNINKWLFRKKIRNGWVFIDAKDVVRDEWMDIY